MTAARCVILAAGPVDNPEALRGLLREDDWFVAADGGLRLAQRLGVDMPVTGTMYSVLYEGFAPREAVQALMGRQLKEE